MTNLMCTYNHKFNGLGESRWFAVPSIVDPKASRRELGCFRLGERI